MPPFAGAVTDAVIGKFDLMQRYDNKYIEQTRKKLWSHCSIRVDRKARTGRNPATGEAIKIPAKKVVKFRVAKAAKDSIVPPKKK